MRKIVGCFIFTVLILSSHAQDSLRFISANTGAACQAVEIYENFLITGTGSTLRIYDISTPIPYDTVWEYRYSSVISRLYISDHYLYVAANFDGLTKWDLSDPQHPQKIFEICRASSYLETPVVDVAIQNDTIFLAMLYKLSAWKDLGNQASLIADFGPVIGNARITGLAVKNEILACTYDDLSPQNGVRFYNSHNFSFFGYYHQPSLYLPERLIWGRNNNLLHVLGGTNSINGYFYSLDVSDPANPVLVFSDTIPGVPLLAVANAMNADNVNDTIYVATEAGLRPGGFIDTSYIYVYDAVDPSNVRLVGYLPAGLWHFDVAVDKQLYYVASEWYGILTGDISDFAHPRVLGLTRTGGWNVSADKHGNYLAVANEGYGFKLYDVSSIKKPRLVGINNDPGFCLRIRFSDDGNYIYASYLTTKGFRVFRCPTLEALDSLSQFPGTGKMQVCGNRVFIQNTVNNNLYTVNVANPSSVFISTTLHLPLNDMLVSGEKLLIASDDSILVYELSSGKFDLLVNLALPLGHPSRVLAVHDNDVFVFLAGTGLVKFKLVFNNPGYSLVEQNTWVLPFGIPTLMAADSFGLYISYRTKGLFLLDPTTMNQKNYYRGELDYKGYANQWGDQELFCRDNLVFLAEYFSQTTILSADNHFNPDDVPSLITMPVGLFIFPNPSADVVKVKVLAGSGGKLNLQMVEMTGRPVMELADVREGVVSLNLRNLPVGLYFIYLKRDNVIIAQEKIIHIK